MEKLWNDFCRVYVFIIFSKTKFSHFCKGENNLSSIRKGRPVIFVSGHFANFELMSMEITKREIKLATIYRPLNNIFLNPLMEYLRRNMFVKIKYKKGSLV